MRSLLFAVLVVVLGSNWVNAQTQGPAAGADMWTSEMGRLNLFVPHRKACAVNETFVAIAPSGRGFCIEKTRRPAAQWQDARHACLQDGKRLPEFAELRFACDHRVALGITEIGPSATSHSGEWATNFVVATGHDPGYGVVAIGAGSSLTCDTAFHLYVGRSSPGSAQATAFRCVR